MRDRTPALEGRPETARGSGNGSQDGRPSSARPLARALALVALATLGGCASGGEVAPRDETVTAGRDWWQFQLPPDPQVEVELERSWADLPRNDKGEREAVAVAQWVAERYRATQRCLNHEPPALTQAIGLLEEILHRVPDSSRDRRTLADCYFAKASYWFRIADVLGYYMHYMDYFEALPGPPGPHDPGRKLTREEVDAITAEMRADFDAAHKTMRDFAGKSLAAYVRYRQQRPEDKAIADPIWKLHFYLQDYRESLRWLDYVLAEFDLAGVPKTELVRRDYEEIREQILDWLARLPTGATPGARPGEPAPRPLIQSLTGPDPTRSTYR